MLDGKDAFTSIDAVIDAGLTQTEVADRVQEAVGPECKVSHRGGVG